MTLEAKVKLRLQFLVRVVRKECQHLASTDQRLFANTFTLTQVQQLEVDPEITLTTGDIAKSLKKSYLAHLENKFAFLGFPNFYSMNPGFDTTFSL
jgi:hypothetical protein